MECGFYSYATRQHSMCYCGNDPSTKEGEIKINMGEGSGKISSSAVSEDSISYDINQRWLTEDYERVELPLQ